ncbi:MAG: hypothetical protein ACYCYL_05100 [Acidithiobacillus sp.]
MTSQGRKKNMWMPGVAGGRSGEGGQAMAEMAIASAFLLVPIFLIIPLLGKYIDIKANSLQAARYAAFEGTIFASGMLRGANVATLSGTGLQNAIATRFFGQSPDTLTNQQNQSASGYTPKNLLVDQAGKALLPNYSDIPASSSDGAPSVAADPEDAGLSVSLGALAGLAGFQWDYNGLIAATVSANTQPPTATRDQGWLASGAGDFDQLALPFTSTDVLLSDAESAPSPQSNSKYVYNQISSLVPLSKLSFVNSALSVLKYGIPDLSGLDIGKILTNDPNEVPADRLASYQGGSGGSSSGNATPAQQAQTVITEMTKAGDTLQSNTTDAQGNIHLVFTTPGGTDIPITISAGGSSPQNPGAQTTTTQSTQDVSATANSLTSSLTTSTPAWTQVPVANPPWLPANWAAYGTGGATATFTQQHVYANQQTTETMVVTITPIITNGKVTGSTVTTTTSSSSGPA